jgi:hypothetical protein
MRQLRCTIAVVTMVLTVFLRVGSASAAPQASIPAYPDKTSGLKKLLQDFMKAEKDGDQQKLKGYGDSFAVPDPDAWFTKVFGPRFGPTMAKTYKQQTPLLRKSLDKTFAGALRDKMNEIDSRRFEKACDSSADEHEYPVLAIRQQEQPFYEARLVNGSYATELTFFVYVDGAFRYLPNPAVPEMTSRFKVTRIASSADAASNKDSVETDYTPVAIVHQVPPFFPGDALRDHQQGSVKLNVLIGADNSIKEMYALSGRCVFVEPAEQAVKKWTFSAATVGGSPQEAYTTVSVNFTLSN